MLMGFKGSLSLIKLGFRQFREVFRDFYGTLQAVFLTVFRVVFWQFSVSFSGSFSGNFSSSISDSVSGSASCSVSGSFGDNFGSIFVGNFLGGFGGSYGCSLGVTYGMGFRQHLNWKFSVLPGFKIRMQMQWTVLLAQLQQVPTQEIAHTLIKSRPKCLIFICLQKAPNHDTMTKLYL